MAHRQEPGPWREKDGRSWTIGGEPEVDWIEKHVTSGKGITAAIPPRFEAYATIRLPVRPTGSGGWGSDEPFDHHDATVLGVLARHTPPQDWWLGYLDTGGNDIIFYDAPKTILYGWEYVLVRAGADQAGSWRSSWGRWKGILPDLMFPLDRTWVASMLWDDYWTGLGGPRELIQAFRDHPDLGCRTHAVDPSDADATPPTPSAT